MTLKQLRTLVGDNKAMVLGHFQARGVKCVTFVWHETPKTVTLSWVGQYDGVTYGTNLEVNKFQQYDTFLEALMSNARETLQAVKGRP